jgi:mannitol/fructose-specific phosphotransferase system IIA component (Ntr-type)
MLSDYITADMIRLQVEAADWREAVRVGGELLVKAGKCEPRYVDAMIQAVEDMGPYMVLAPGLSLAHARPEDGVLELGLSIITLKDPVEFGSKANDPVSLVISFGGVDKESHIGMLRELAQFLVDEENQKLLREATSVETIMRAFEEES